MNNNMTADSMREAFEKTHKELFGWEITRPEHYDDALVKQRFLIFRAAWQAAQQVQVSDDKF